MPRIGSTKTRTGCRMCRARKVKCDEQKPTCAKCARLGAQCEYVSLSYKGKRPPQSSKQGLEPAPIQILPLSDTPDFSHASAAMTTEMASTTTPTTATATAASTTSHSHLRDHDMELRMLHAWMCRGLGSLGGTSALDEWQQMWFSKIPKLALDHLHLLYALLTFSATRQLGADPHSERLHAFRDRYWEMTLQEQRRAVTALPVASIESLSVTAYLISFVALGMLHDRELEPYQPPVQWFEVAKGAWKLQSDSAGHIANQHTSIDALEAISHLSSPQWIKMDAAVANKGPIAPEYASMLTYQLEEERQHYALSSSMSDQLRTYEETLAVITEFRIAVLAQEPAYCHARRMSMLPNIIPAKFGTFLEQGRPRALVMLAALFSIISRARIMPLFGDERGTTPYREFHAIAGVLPVEWQGMLRWSLDELVPPTAP